jgi:hypothetical protein
MTVIGDNLLISGGRSVPACYDRKTGKFKYFRTPTTAAGGADVAAIGNVYFAGGMAYDGDGPLHRRVQPSSGDRRPVLLRGKSKDLQLSNRRP